MKQKNAPSKGSLLISKPLIGDGFFEQSIVYLTEHNHEGSMGFALNKESLLLAQDFINDLEGKDAIVFGGPVEQDALFFLHSFDNLPGAKLINNDIYFGGDFDVFQEAFRTTQKHSIESRLPKLFLGYSGWSEGQLEREIADGTWIVVNPPLELDPLTVRKETWKEYMLDLGGNYALWANAPKDPLLN
ncbi:MAG: YqgE/AlgH family protein [Schleiferiaceae bacterium]|jgi:putative transcriptional regulator|tara:strand:- start:693 stop:1256 length:564 start_codon:yes stop_codon:yes gene_type:complete